MKLDLTKIIYVGSLDVNEIINLDEKYFKGTEIRHLSPIKVAGQVITNNQQNLIINLSLTGEMILPCAITLVDVKYSFKIDIVEEAEIKDFPVANNQLDLTDLIVQNIIVEIPLKVVSDDAENIKLKGDGWELLSSEDEIDKIDPRLEKLKEFLDK